MRAAAPWLVASVLVLVYPVVRLASGAPEFPKRADCLPSATADGHIDAVFGYFDSLKEAANMRDRALAVGFAGTELAWTPCGRVRVVVGGVPTLEVGRQFVEEARKAGFDVTLEPSTP